MKITQQRVARKAGVSQTTVSLALRSHPSIPRPTQAAVFRACRELGYARARPAGGSARTGCIAYVVTGGGAAWFDSDPYYHRLVAGVAQGAKALGHDVMLVSLDPGERFPAAPRRRKVDGLLVSKKVDRDWVEEAQTLFPVVLLNHALDDSPVDAVVSDARDAMRQALAHLAGFGHRRIALFGMTPLGRQGDELVAGYFEGLKTHGLPGRADRVKIYDRVAGGLEEVETCVRRALGELMAKGKPPTAVVTTGDVYALCLVRVAAELGFPVPQGLSVVGCDDVVACQNCVPPLTSLREPLEEMGQVAVQLLVERIRQHERTPRRVTLPMKLIVRKTTGATPCLTKPRVMRMN